MRLPLKDCQKETLDRLAEYCATVRSCYDRNVSGYYAPPGFENVPYVCLQLPTGGGKTLLASMDSGLSIP